MSKFIIEHYPRTNRYYVRKRSLLFDKFFWKVDYSNEIILTDRRWRATTCYDREDALELIELYKEQRYKKTVNYEKIK